MNDINLLREKAEIGRELYRANQITREEAKEMIIPYIDYANKKSKEIAKKYNMKPKLIGFINYVR